MKNIELTTSESDLKNIHWMITARWVAVVIIFFGALLADLLTPYDIAPVVAVAVFVAGYNTILMFRYGAWKARSLPAWPGELPFALNFQLSLDIFVLAVSIYITGGVNSNLMPVYLVFLPAIGLVLPRKAAFQQATLAILLLGLMFWAVYWGWLPFHDLVQDTGPGFSKDAGHITRALVFQATFFYLSAFIAGDISSRLRRSLEAERRSRRHAETLRKMAAVLSTTLESPQLLNMILKHLAELIVYDSALVGVFRGQIFEPLIAQGLNHQEHTARKEIDLSGDSLVEQVLLSRRPLVTNGSGEQSAFWETIGMDRVRSGICTPLMARDTVIGLLVVGNSMAGYYGEEEMDLVQTFAHHAALAVENARLYEEMRLMAQTDGLTGLYNRRHFFAQLELELQRSQRYGRNLSLLMCDLDFFKRYNDRYGHLAGDDLLCDLAGLLKRKVRHVDTVFRYGGEEFVVILPETDQFGAVEIADRIRRAVEAHVFSIRDQASDERITISIGVASYPQDASDLEAVVNAADMALFQAKKQRNRVCAL